MTRRRVVIAGLGDSGVLTAIRLAKHVDVVGISVKPALVSGQELGLRVSRPHDWARDYWLPFDRLRRLDRVRTVHGAVSGVDLEVDLYFPAQRPLREHHPQVWNTVRRRVIDAGVVLHAEHRALVPDGFGCDRITDDPVHRSTGQAPASADAVLWAIDRVLYPWIVRRGIYRGVRPNDPLKTARID